MTSHDLAMSAFVTGFFGVISPRWGFFFVVVRSVVYLTMGA
jgi:hypothetical protein